MESPEVTDARSDNFPWTSHALNPFAPFSTRKPRILSSSHFAQITATSAIEPLVIHIFSPLRMYLFPRLTALVLLDHQAVRHAGHPRAAVTFKARSEEPQLGNLRNQVHRKSRFAVVLGDDGQHFVVHKLPRGLADELFFVVQQRVEFDEVHSGEACHELSLRVPLRETMGGAQLPCNVRGTRRSQHSSKPLLAPASATPQQSKLERQETGR